MLTAPPWKVKETGYHSWGIYVVSDANFGDEILIGEFRFREDAEAVVKLVNGAKYATSM